MEKLAGKRRLIIIGITAVIIVAALFWPASAQNEGTLLQRIYNKLGEIINFLNNDSRIDKLNSKLDAILQNQAEIKEQLHIIKIRASRR